MSRLVAVLMPGHLLLSINGRLVLVCSMHAGGLRPTASYCTPVHSSHGAGIWRLHWDVMGWAGLAPWLTHCAHRQGWG